MPAPGSTVRATADRGTDPVETSPIVESLVAHPLWMGDDCIPDILSDGLESERKFEDAQVAGDFDLVKLMARRLLFNWQFLLAAQDRAPRASDGALLYPNAARSINSDLTYATWTPKQTSVTAPQRPKDVSEIPPFYPLNVRLWTDAQDPTAPRMVALANPPPKRKIDPKALQEALDHALNVFDKISETSVPQPETNTPMIDAARASLSTLTLQDISSQTKVPLSKAVDSPLLAQTDVILFHAASFSVVLDRNGEPTTLGTLPYPILVGEPGHPVVRNVPPTGNYISIQKYGYSTFKIDGRSISKVLFGGVGGFDENFVGGVVARHELHERIQTYLNNQANRFVYIGAVSLPGAFHPRDLTISRIADKLPEIGRASIPYAVEEIKKLLKRQRLEGTVEAIGKEVVEQLIIDYVRKKVRDFVIKELGSKVVPFVNLAFAMYDLAAGEDERRRVRNALAALLVSLRGTSADEDTIAAKVLGQILAEEAHSEVVKLLLRMSHTAVEHATSRDRASRGREQPTEQPPVTEPETPTPASTPPPTNEPPQSLPPSAQPQRVRAPAPAPAAHVREPRSGAMPQAASPTPQPPGLLAGHSDRPAESPTPPVGGTSHDERATKERATPDRHENDPAPSPPPTQNEPTPVLHQPPLAQPHPAAASSKEAGTEAKQANALAATGHEEHAAIEAPQTEATATEDHGFRIGVDAIGDPLSTGTSLSGDHGTRPSRPEGSSTPRTRKFDQRTPESGTPLGFQTQLGKERLTPIGPNQVQVHSRDPNVLIGANTDRHRKDVLRIVEADPNHPLRPIYDPETRDFVKPPYEIGNMDQWSLYPYDWQAGHARSKNAKDADVIILQTRYRNQEQSARLEHTGSVSKDEVFVIGGIAVDKLSAWDLYRAGRLTLPNGQTPDSLPTMKL